MQIDRGLREDPVEERESVRVGSRGRDAEESISRSDLPPVIGARPAGKNPIAVAPRSTSCTRSGTTAVSPPRREHRAAASPRERPRPSARNRPTFGPSADDRVDDRRRPRSDGREVVDVDGDDVLPDFVPPARRLGEDHLRPDRVGRHGDRLPAESVPAPHSGPEAGSADRGTAERWGGSARARSRALPSPPTDRRRSARRCASAPGGVESTTPDGGVEKENSFGPNPPLLYTGPCRATE